jgi:hypothetical protein
MSRARDLGSLINSSAAGKNFIINGGMDIWQRGTTHTFAGTSYQYMPDRWRFVRGNFTTGATISRQITGDINNLPNLQYCARVQRDSGNTSTQYMEFATTLETANSIPLAGKTVTFSFYARKGANYSEVNSNISVIAIYGTGTDQSQENFTSRTGFIGTNVTLTTTWQRFSFTGNINAAAKGIGFLTAYTPTGTAGAADYFEITGIQLEAGSVATPFCLAGGDVAGELAKCQRYYETNYPAGLAPGFNMPNSGTDFASISLSAKMGVTGTTGSNRSRSEARVFAVQKRSTPSVQYWDWVGNLSRYSGGNFDGSRSNDNLTVDAYGGPGVSDKAIAFQTVSASSSIVFASVMWAASAEL